MAQIKSIYYYLSMDWLWLRAADIALPMRCSDGLWGCLGPISHVFVRHGRHISVYVWRWGL